MIDESALFPMMRAAPGDDAPKLIYADWLLGHGDVRGELIILDHRERTATMSLVELDRFLELSARYGFPHLPDDPCGGILRFEGGGSFPTQYTTDHGGHNYYVRWRYGFSIEVDDHLEIECDLDTLTTNEWTFRETTVILAIISARSSAASPSPS